VAQHRYAPERVKELQAGLREKNVGAANLGMDGTWVIHPQQAENRELVLHPSVDQVEEARRVIKLYHEKGGGSMADPKSGEMIDEATIKIGLMDLAKGAPSRIGLRNRAKRLVGKEPRDHRLRHFRIDAPRRIGFLTSPCPREVAARRRSAAGEVRR